MIRFMRQLDMTNVLGNATNRDEFFRLLEVIENTDFKNYPSTWRMRGRKGEDDKDPGRRGTDADFVYYDPIRRELMND